MFLDFGPEDVPAEGPMTLTLDGEGGDVPAKEAGTHTLLAGDFILFVDTGETGPDVGMSCELTDEGDITIDSFEAVAPHRPRPRRPTESAAPVRPVVVQTDFAGEDRSTALPLGARRRPPGRRHRCGRRGSRSRPRRLAPTLRSCRSTARPAGGRRVLLAAGASAALALLGACAADPDAHAA